MKAIRLQIRTSIAVALVAGLMLPGLVAAWYILDRERALLTEQLQAYHRQVVRVLALGMQESVWAMVPALGEPLLESIVTDPRVVSITVFDNDEVFLTRDFPHRRRGASWTLSQPIVRQAETVGRVVVEIDTGQMEAVLSQHARRFVLTSIAQLALSLVIISMVFRLRVLNPLDRLGRQSERLARGELHETFVWKRSDELGELGRRFDSTRRALAELVDELQVKNEELAIANEDLQAALSARNVFLSSMSHELRTPLNSILGFTEILRTRQPGQLDANQLRCLENIVNSSRHLLRLIEDVLDLSKVETGSLELFPETFDVKDVLEGMLNVAKGAADEKRIRLTLDVDGTLPCLTADPGRFKQIVFNLLANAVKFSPEETEVILRAAPLAADDPPLHVVGVRIEVIDQGIGISADQQELIFERFRQADESRGRRYQGTGLGLTLVQRILEHHSGAIEVESELGAGSTFRVFFPQSQPVE